MWWRGYNPSLDNSYQDSVYYRHRTVNTQRREKMFRMQAWSGEEMLQQKEAQNREEFLLDVLVHRRLGHKVFVWFLGPSGMTLLEV